MSTPTAAELRKTIVGANDAELTPEEVPEWGTTVYIRLISGADRDRIQQELADRTVGDDLTSIRGLKALLLACCLCDAHGERIWDPNLPADLEEIDSKCAFVLERLWERADELNAITDAAQANLEKKSTATPSPGTG